MMHFYKITYETKSVDGNYKKDFFVWAQTQVKAISRFCSTSGNKRVSIVSIYKMR